MQEEKNLDLAIANFIRDLGFGSIIFYISFFKFNISFLNTSLFLLYIIAIHIGLKIFKRTIFFSGFIKYTTKILSINLIFYIILIITINLSK